MVSIAGYNRARMTDARISALNGIGMMALRIVAASAFVLASFCASADPLYVWTQYTPGGVEARAIVEPGACPSVMLDGAPATMALRAAPDQSFPVAVCALALPKDVQKAEINGRPIALPKVAAQKILLIGDTGCRVKYVLMQACNDPKAWPFHQIAQSAAAMGPDLVVHLGDYHYRETVCAPFNKGCAGSPSGDNWATWRAEFFEPAGDLLTRAPFVFVRGNHELCARAGAGWTRFIDPYPFAPDQGCRSKEPPYLVDLDGVALLAMDVSDADENTPDAEAAAFYKTQFVAAEAVKGPVFIAMHKPIWIYGANQTLALAARNVIPANVQAILSGHRHVFEVVSYESDLPAQIVAGNGGDWLQFGETGDFSHKTILGVEVKFGRTLPDLFGFALLERARDHWLLHAYDMDAHQRMECALKARDLVCPP